MASQRAVLIDTKRAFGFLNSAHEPVVKSCSLVPIGEDHVRLLGDDVGRAVTPLTPMAPTWLGWSCDERRLTGHRLDDRNAAALGERGERVRSRRSSARLRRR